MRTSKLSGKTRKIVRKLLLEPGKKATPSRHHAEPFKTLICSNLGHKSLSNEPLDLDKAISRPNMGRNRDCWKCKQTSLKPPEDLRDNYCFQLHSTGNVKDKETGAQSA